MRIKAETVEVTCVKNCVAQKGSHTASQILQSVSRFLLVSSHVPTNQTLLNSSTKNHTRESECLM
jgi:hypothetical protein